MIDELSNLDDRPMLPESLDEALATPVDWSELDKIKNPHLGEKGFHPLKQEKDVHRAAFLYWIRLDDSNRTDKAVADKFQKSPAIVGRWRKSFNWEARRIALLREDLKAKAEVATTTISDDLISILQGCKLITTSFIQDVKANNVQIGVKDFIQICDLMLKIRRELNITGSSPDNKDIDELDKILDKQAEGTRSLIAGFIGMIVSGKAAIPADQIIEADAARVIQNATEIYEIGEERLAIPEYATLIGDEEEEEEEEYE